MTLIWSLLLQLAGLLLAAYLILLVWAVYYHISTSTVPSGVCQPLKLRFLHISIIVTFGLNYIFWKMGICKQLSLVRFMLDGIPPSRDPALCIKNTFFESVSVRIYRPKVSSAEQRKGIVYYHGGNGIFGSIEAYERMCRYIAKKSDAVLVSVGYHLAPESPYPSQFNECYDATVYFMKNSEKYGVDPARIILCGDSFGGTVTAYLCQELKCRTDLPKVRAQVLLYPFLQALDFTLPSYQQNSRIPIVPRRELLKFAAKYLDQSPSMIDMAIAGNFMPESLQEKYDKYVNPDNIPQTFRDRNVNPAPPRSSKDNLFNMMNEALERKLSPLLADDCILRGLPETFFLTCEFDVMRDDSLLYMKRLEENGVLVSWYHLEDGFHSAPFLVYHWFVTFPCAKVGLDSVVNFIKGL